MKDKLADGAYYYINDHLGAPQVITDDAGSVVWKAEYLPFGNVNILTAEIENNLRFPGQYFDTETGLHYNWNRYYDPETGRYIAADPIGLNGGLNLYAYVGGDPVNGMDFEGLAEVLPGPFGIPVPIPGPITPIKAPSPANWFKDHYNPDNWLKQAWDYWKDKFSDNIKDCTHNPGKDCEGNCKECTPPKGTICYTVKHDNHSHHPWRDHHHLFQMNQAPDCTCRWGKINKDIGKKGAIDIPPSGAIPCPFSSW